MDVCSWLRARREGSGPAGVRQRVEKGVGHLRAAGVVHAGEQDSDRLGVGHDVKISGVRRRRGERERAQGRNRHDSVTTPALEPEQTLHLTADPSVRRNSPPACNQHCRFDIDRLLELASMARICELGRCPSGCGNADVVVTCTGSKLGALKTGVHCRFGSTSSTACIYEEESGTLCCSPPKVFFFSLKAPTILQTSPENKPPPSPHHALGLGSCRARCAPCSTSSAFAGPVADGPAQLPALF